MRPLALLLLPLAALASPLPSAACTEAGWTIKDMKVKFGAGVQQGGQASFTLVNNATSKSDSLTCALRANSRCLISGTPTDKSLKMEVQIDTGVLYVTLNANLECDGKNSWVPLIRQSVARTERLLTQITGRSRRQRFWR
jgi:hypothetical protein